MVLLLQRKCWQVIIIIIQIFYALLNMFHLHYEFPENKIIQIIECFFQTHKSLMQHTLCLHLCNHWWSWEDKKVKKINKMALIVFFCTNASHTILIFLLTKFFYLLSIHLSSILDQYQIWIGKITVDVIRLQIVVFEMMVGIANKIVWKFVIFII